MVFRRESPYIHLMEIRERNEVIRLLRAAGHSHWKIARIFHISGERVRQILQPRIYTEDGSRWVREAQSKS